jgi:hypothetical protein
MPFTEPTSEMMAPLEMGRDVLRDRPAGADRNGQDDEVRILHGLGICVHHAIDDAEFAHALSGLWRTCGGHDLSGKFLRTGCARDRAADQAKADQRNAFEQGAPLTSAP